MNSIEFHKPKRNHSVRLDSLAPGSVFRKIGRVWMVVAKDRDYVKSNQDYPVTVISLEDGKFDAFYGHALVNEDEVILVDDVKLTIGQKD